MLKNLKVKIPKKFKKQLIARFSVSNAKFCKLSDFSYLEDRYEIDLPCPLCEVYYNIRLLRSCYNCPFSKFARKSAGCLQWMRRVLNVRIWNYVSFENGAVYWDLRNNKQARKQLKKLKTQAKKYIEWV